MWQLARRLSLGVFLIVLASAILLLSDKSRDPAPATGDARKVRRVALFQLASQPILDEGAAGVLDSLRENGFHEGPEFQLKRFNAEGDNGVANAIAQELVGGDYDLVITLTTGALQAVANANKQRRVPHVFGLVSDPIRAGVEIGTDPLDHPAHLVGIGTFPPVDQALELARRLNPRLTRVGLAWNPAEINSEICTLKAREVCRDLKIELIEANVESTAAVKEVVGSLIDQRVDALLVGGDVTMLGAMDVVAQAARDAKIPTFTCLPGNAAKGALFDVGANYYEVGRTVGKVATRVLNGESIASIPVEIAIPPKLFINTVAQKSLKDSWTFPEDVLQSADATVDDTGLKERKAKPAPPAAPAVARPLSRRWTVRILSYVVSQDAAEAERGLREGLKLAGLVEDRDYQIQTLNAQGDMTNLSGLVDAALADHADLILTISTQALQTAVQRARNTPIVFTMVANPFAAGVGKNDADHLPNVTGAYGANDVRGMMPIIAQVLPSARRLGTLFAPVEINSMYSYELLVEAARDAKFELLSHGVNAGTEILDATHALCDQKLDAICLSNSNLTGASFPAVAQAARQGRVPVFAFMGGTANQGALVVLTRDYYDMGVDAARVAARVMRGEAPAAIPFHASTQSRLLINRVTARSLGIEIPESLLKRADRVIDK